ncbi:MAG: DUF190 domain-containing protein [Blastocatellia bacterium]
MESISGKKITIFTSEEKRFHHRPMYEAILEELRKAQIAGATADLPPAARQSGFPDIARQLIEFAHGNGPEVVFGGGRTKFLPNTTPDPEYPDRRGERKDNRNLVDEWRRRSPRSAYVWSKSQFDAVDPRKTARPLSITDRCLAHALSSLPQRSYAADPAHCSCGPGPQPLTRRASSLWENSASALSDSHCYLPEAPTPVSPIHIPYNISRRHSSTVLDE